VAALQAAFPGDREGAEPPFLRLSRGLLWPPVVGELPGWNEAPEVGPGLRLAATLASPPEVVGPPAEAVAAESLAPPMRFSQKLAPSSSRPQNPRWQTLPEAAVRLRPARGLGLPGVAGLGRPPGGGAGQPALGVDDGEASAEGAFVARSAPAMAPGSPPAPAAVDRGLAGSGWEIPPIRWGGSLGYSLQKSSSGSANSTSAQGVFANLNASSYIYAPWFATVSGRLGITSSSSNSSSSAAASGESSKSNNLVGGGEINMFSSSRFPFRAYFDRSDSRTNGTFVSQDYISTRFGLTQNYRSEDAMKSGSFMLDRSALQTSDGRRDTVTALSGSYSTQTGPWQHNMNGRYSLGERQGTGEMARLIGFNTSHNANISDNANLSATLNYFDNDLRTADSAGGFFTSRGRYLQLFTYGSWMPEFEDLDDLPLTLNGSLHYGSQDTKFGDVQTTAQTVGGNLSALYRFSRNLTASANSALNHISLSSGESRVLTLLGTNINYVGNPLTIGNFSYNWNVGSNANWQSGSGDVPASSVFGGIATHTLSRVYSLADGQTLSLSYAQALNVTNSQLVGSSQSLSNNLSANYGMSFGERFSGALTGMLSDVYTTGVNAQHYRNVNFGLLGQGQLSQQSSLNLNLMFNWTDQTHQTQDAFGLPQTQNNQQATLNGSVNYSHQRFAGVRGLRYNLLFAADTRLRDDRLYGNFNTEQQDRSRLSLTNRFDYSIGLLNFRLSLVNNEVGGKKNALLFFQVTRQIGSY